MEGQASLPAEGGGRQYAWGAVAGVVLGTAQWFVQDWEFGGSASLHWYQDDRIDQVILRGTRALAARVRADLSREVVPGMWVDGHLAAPVWGSSLPLSLETAIALTGMW